MSDEQAPNATRVGASSSPVVIEDVTAEELINVFVGRRGLKSMLGVPLLVRRDVIGCALFYRNGGTTRFTPAEEDFASKFGASVSLALENARLYQAEREMTERMHEKDVAIRRAYVDVIDAATGGKLVLVTREELTELLGVPVAEPERIDCPTDASDGRRVMTERLRELERPVRDEDGLVLAAFEAITNSCKHGGGTAQWSIRASEKTIQVVVEDTGDGIDFKTLPKATLTAGFSTKMSLGMGFTIMLEVCDRVLLTTQPGYTCVVLEMGFAPGG